MTLSVVSVSSGQGVCITVTAIIYVERLGLNTMTLSVVSVSVSSGQGVCISVTGIAQVRAKH